MNPFVRRVLPSFFSLVLVFATMLAPTAQAGVDSEVEEAIEHYIKSLRSKGVIRRDERTAWLVHDFTTGKKLASINENTSLQAASMIKPYLALAFFHQVKAGRIIYGSTSRRHMELMIQKSNNTSTNWVMQQTGGPSATQALLKRYYPDLCRNIRLIEYIPKKRPDIRQSRVSRGLFTFSHCPLAEAFAAFQ